MSPGRPRPGKDVLVAWILAGIIGLFGLSKFVAPDAWEPRFEAWGYPAWMSLPIGAAQVAAAALTVWSRTRWYGAVALWGLMVGALATKFAAGGTWLFEAALVAACLWLVWVARPAWTDRFLPSPQQR